MRTKPVTIACISITEYLLEWIFQVSQLHLVKPGGPTTTVQASYSRKAIAEPQQIAQYFASVGFWVVLAWLICAHDGRFALALAS